MRLLLRNGTASLVHADAGGAVLAMAIAGSQPAKSVALGTLGGGVQLLDVAKRTASRCEAEAEPATGEAELSAINSARVSGVVWDKKLPQLLYASTDAGQRPLVIPPTWS